MSAFAFLVLCFQACLIQNAFGQFCGTGPASAYSLGAAPCGLSSAIPAPYNFPALPSSAPCGLSAAIPAPYNFPTLPSSAQCGLSAAVPAPYSLPALASSPYASSIPYTTGFTSGGYTSPSYSGYGAAYGGTGVGNVAVAGELPVGGSTALVGQVPIIGAVEYSGPVAAAGAVTITGTCSCNAPAHGYNYGNC